MTKREIAAVACRLLALAMMGFGWVTLAKPLADRLLGSNSLALDNAYALPVVGGIVWLIISVVVWTRAEVYAARMMPDDLEPVTSVDLKAEDGFSIGSVITRRHYRVHFLGSRDDL